MNNNVGYTLIVSSPILGMLLLAISLSQDIFSILYASIFLVMSLVVAWYVVLKHQSTNQLIPRAQMSDKQKRNQRMLENGGRHTERQWNALCEGYNYRCVRCGKKGSLTKDHILPVSLGGGDDIDNIQPLCFNCNTWKGAKLIDFRNKQRKGK